MTQEQYEEAQKIQWDLQRFKLLRSAILDSGPESYELKIENVYCSLEDVKYSIYEYINRRICELEKEFKEL